MEWMRLTPWLIDIIQSLSRDIISVQLHLCLNHLCFSLVPYSRKAKNTMLKKMIASMIQKWQETIIHTLYLVFRDINSSCSFRDSQIMPAVRWMNIDDKLDISQRLLVIPVLVWRHPQVHPKFSPVVWCVSELITITPWYSCTHHLRSQLLQRLAGIPFLGLILSQNWHF